MTMGWIAVGTAVLGAGASIYGANKASSTQQAASKAASDTSLQSTRESIAFQEKMFDKQLALQAPWLKAGENALAKLQDKVDAGPGDYTSTPGYEFRKAEGEKAIERSAAARGGALGGRTLKELTRFGQDYATNDYDNFLRRYYESLTPLQSLAGVGQSTASQTAGASQNLGANVGNALVQSGMNVSQNQINAGQAEAAGQINMANSITGNANSGVNNYLMWKYMNPGTPAVSAAPVI